MDQRLFLHTKNSDINSSIISELERKVNENEEFHTYVISSPLGEKYEYEYEQNALVLLIPKHKIIFINLINNSNDFDLYVDDFIDDLSAISDKYKYKKHIGRAREWSESNILKIGFGEYINIDNILKLSRLEDKRQQRISDLLISLLIGSINDIEKIGGEVPNTLLEKVKKNIILFDGEQTRFIYKDFPNKSVVIQGLSGTGKTELLLHKLKDLYLNDENSKIFFTCHNIALANTLRERVPSFFNFMKVERQIEWNKNLWVNRAWGSKGDKNSGLYSYLCSFYEIPFLRWSYSTDYTTIFTLALDYLEKIPKENFKYALDYVLVDERQDFPEVFFKVLDKVVRKKIFIAGDIFQDIFETSRKEVLNVDVILNKCYRTDPRTLMFAHSIGLGLFEERKYNWFDDKEWEAFGYNIERFDNREIRMSRNPIRRFEDVNIDSFTSATIIRSTTNKAVIDVIHGLIQTDNNVGPNDIAIIVLEEDKDAYTYIDRLCAQISSTFGWDINRAYENKIKIDNALFISNPNNVKGLEFPFVICLSSSIKNSYRYRNLLYTMLTRSFLNSYLMVTEPTGLEQLEEGLKIINTYKYIKATEPTEREKLEIKNELVQFLMKPTQSFKEFLEVIFDKESIDPESRPKLEEALLQSKIERFDEEKTIQFVKSFKNFY